MILIIMILIVIIIIILSSLSPLSGRAARAWSFKRSYHQQPEHCPAGGNADGDILTASWCFDFHFIYYQRVALTFVEIAVENDNFFTYLKGFNFIFTFNTTEEKIYFLIYFTFTFYIIEGLHLLPLRLQLVIVPWQVSWDSFEFDFSFSIFAVF